MSDHAVIVHFINYPFGNDLDPLFALEEELVMAIEDANVGEYDGNEIAVDGNDGTLYMYGPDADRLFEAVRPTLEACAFMKGAQVTKRYGSPEDNAEEVTITVGS